MRVVLLHNAPAEGADPSEAGVLVEVADVAAALRASGFDVEPLAVTPPSLLTDLAALARARSREGDGVVVFHLCEGLAGEAWHEVTVASLLELLGLPYTGNPPRALAWCLDKRVAKAVLRGAGVPTPPARVFRTAPRPRTLERLSYPRVVKPCREDASLGVDQGALVETPEALCRRVAWCLERFRQPVLAEAYVEGREFNVSVMGEAEGARVLPLAEVRFAPGMRLVTHAAKWRPGSEEDRGTRVVCPAQVPAVQRVRLEAAALSAYRALECRDYARVDLRLDPAGQPHVLEVNPNPDISREAGFARAAAASGQAYEALVARLVAWARERAR
ncbi:MAG: hypothetical protein Kow0092_08220 [Deferrisomatales bacterium]